MTRLFPRGFLSDSHFLYDLKANADDYLSDYARLRTQRINGKFAEILNNKLSFTHVVGQRLRTPENLAVILRGSIYPLDTSTANEGEHRWSAWPRAGVAIKPVASGAGKGVQILRWRDERPQLNGVNVDDDLIESLIRGLDDYLVTALVQQSAFAASFFPDTTNTIRILTMMCPQTQRPFIAIAVQRMGSKKSMPVDNWSQGGLSAEINLETGELGPGATFPIRGVLQWHETHPDTNQPIKGMRVPNWQSICEAILAAVEHMPYLRYVGWDVVLTDRGPVILEGNNYSDVNLLQVHRPLLADPRVRAFYRHHGVIR